MFSLMLYSLTSTTVSALVLLYAVATRIRFYPVVVFLFTSKMASASMMNQAIVFTILLGVGCVRLFLGKLRDAEWEAVWEHMRFSITETAFALTTFRDELNMRVGILFGVIIFAKVFHLLNEARVEHVEQAHQTSWKAHLRIAGLSLTLFTLNGIVLSGCSVHLSTYGPSVYLLFAFEHAILLVSLLAMLARYAMAVYDMNFVHGRWQNKSQYEMYIALVSDALQFAAYFVFAGVVFTYYGPPIHLARPVWVAFRNLAERARHLIRYRRIMRTLDQCFPDATAAELDATDKVCIICREDMEIGGPAGAPKKLQCGHLFHSLCLQNWLERQLSCPTCRRKIDMDQQAPPGQAAPAAAPVANQQPAAAGAAQAPPAPVAAAAAEQQPAQLPANQEPRQAAGDGVAGGGEQRPAAAPQEERSGGTPAVVIERAQDAAMRVGGAMPGAASAGIRQSLDRRFPQQNAGGAAASAEEEKVEAAGEGATVPGSPPVAAMRRPAAPEEVLFEDADFARATFGTATSSVLGGDFFGGDKLNSRLRLLQLEERVYQAQARAAKEAQEFALKVLRLQQQQ